MSGPVRCGELACQKDSYAHVLPAVRVVSCVPRASAPAPPKGKADKKKGGTTSTQAGPLFDVVLADTVLFPEGGGQPADHGAVGGVPCIGVENVDGVAVHLLTAPVVEGSEVDVTVDWARRWDHATQHSAQHLLTALATRLWGFETISWNLGESTSFLELGTPEFSGQQVHELERAANEAIRAGHAVEPSWHDAEQIKLGNVDGLRKSAKALPDSVLGPVRIITIRSIDANTCCGTHVQSTAHLHAIKLLKVDTGKTSCKLHFVAADRVLAALGASHDREQRLAALLSVGSTDLVSSVEALCLKHKALDKAAKALTLELVDALAAPLRDKAAAGTRVLTVHRDSCETQPEFFRALGSALDDTLAAGAGALLLCTVGVDGDGAGSFLLAGPGRTLLLLLHVCVRVRVRACVRTGKCEHIFTCKIA